MHLPVLQQQYIVTSLFISLIIMTSKASDQKCTMSKSNPVVQSSEYKINSISHVTLEWNGIWTWFKLCTGGDFVLTTSQSGRNMRIPMATFQGSTCAHDASTLGFHLMGIPVVHVYRMEGRRGNAVLQ